MHNLPSANWWTLSDTHLHEPALGFLFITFMLFLGGLFYLLKTPLKVHFQTKSEHIAQAILSSQQVHQAALGRLEAAQKRLAALPHELERAQQAMETQIHDEKIQGDIHLREQLQLIETESQKALQDQFKRAQLKLQHQLCVLALEDTRQTLSKGFIS